MAPHPSPLTTTTSQTAPSKPPSPLLVCHHQQLQLAEREALALRQHFLVVGGGELGSQQGAAARWRQQM